MTANHPYPAPKGYPDQARPPARFALRLRQMRLFWRDEAGAITVDWVALSVAILAMIAALFASLVPQILGWIASAPL